MDRHFSVTQVGWLICKYKQKHEDHAHDTLNPYDIIFVGGPLIRTIDNALIGIVSECFYAVGNTGLHTVHTQIFAKVHHYLDWITEVTGLDLEQNRL